MDALSKIAQKYDTDKGLVHHGYTPIYDKYLSELRTKKIKFLEIGFGGYEYFDRGGGSAKMWREYFSPDSEIFVTDIHDKYAIEGVRFFNVMYNDIRELAVGCDVILDDGSHINKEIIKTFNKLFPILNSGGLYIVEDLETSYWGAHGYEGHPDPFQTEVPTSMNYFLKLVHQVNSESFKSEYHNEFTGLIEYIHFYRNLVIIKKK
jgi:hypothetical protein